MLLRPALNRGLGEAQGPDRGVTRIALCAAGLGQNRGGPVEHDLAALPAAHRLERVAVVVHLEVVREDRLHVQPALEHRHHLVPGLEHLAAVGMPCGARPLKITLVPVRSRAPSGGTPRKSPPVRRGSSPRADLAEGVSVAARRQADVEALLHADFHHVGQRGLWSGSTRVAPIFDASESRYSFTSAITTCRAPTCRAIATAMHRSGPHP
jgi:hypothetical protein